MSKNSKSAFLHRNESSIYLLIKNYWNTYQIIIHDTKSTTYDNCLQGRDFWVDVGRWAGVDEVNVTKWGVPGKRHRGWVEGRTGALKELKETWSLWTHNVQI